MGKFCGWGGGRITGTRLLLPGWCWGHGVLSTLPPLPGGTAPAFPGPQGVRKGAGSPSGCRGRSRAAPGWASLMGEFVGWVLSLCPRMGQPLFILYNKRSSSSPAVLLPALLLSPPACSCTLRVPGPQPPPSTGTEQVSFTHTHARGEEEKFAEFSQSPKEDPDQSGAKCIWSLLDEESPSHADFRPLGGHSQASEGQDGLQVRPHGALWSPGQGQGTLAECSGRQTVKRKDVQAEGPCSRGGRTNVVWRGQEGLQVGQQPGIAGQTTVGGEGRAWPGARTSPLRPQGTTLV